MSRSSARRGQAEPLAALVAVVAVGAGVSLYAGALADARIAGAGPGPGPGPGSDPDATAGTAADRALERVAPVGVARPGRMADLPSVAPSGYRLNATLTCGTERWTVGPPAPSSATARADRPTSVRTAPGRIRPGTLRVVIWS